MKKSTRVLAFIMAMVTMFTFVCFAADAEEKPTYSRFINSIGDSEGTGSKQKPWGYDAFQSENVRERLEKQFLENEKVSSVTIFVEGDVDYKGVFYISGFNAPADKPLIISGNYNGSAPTLEGANIRVMPQEAEATAIVVEDCSNVIIKNFDIFAPEGDGIHVENSENVTFQNINTYKSDESVTKTVNSPVSIGDGVNGLVLSHCNFTHFTNAIEVTASTAEDAAGIDNITLSDCTVEFCEGAALLVDGVDGITVNNLTVTSAFNGATETITDAAVVLKNTSHATLSGATINTCPGPAITLNNVKDTTVEKVYSNTNAAFMINELGADCNVRIRYCISAYDDDLVTAISTTDASGVYVYNNTFHGTSQIDMDKLSNSVIKNNIYDVIFLAKVNINKDNEFGSNYYYNTFKTAGDKNSKLKHPQYAKMVAAVFPLVTDFILADDSVLIGAGEQVEENMGTTDIYGTSLEGITAYNVGAYQGAGIPSEAGYSQGSEIFTFIWEVVKLYGGQLLQKVMDMFIPRETQEKLIEAVTKLGNFLTDALTKLIGLFTKD